MNERIKRIRNDKKMNQTDFAKRISVSRSAICKMESGENSPSEQTIKLICTEFHVNEEWLRTGSGEPYKDSTRDEQIAAAIASIQSEGDETFKYRLISALTQLNESDWEVLSRLIDSISSKE